VSASPILKHQRVSLRLVDLLYDLEKAGHGYLFEAPTDVELAPHEIVVPDLVFVLTAHRAILGRHMIQGVPDLIIEILSPSTGRIDEGEKRDLYARVGVPEYWLIDPARETVRAFTLEAGAYAPIAADDGGTRSRVLPPFVVGAGALFAGLD